MSNYLKHKPGSLEEIVAKQGSYKEDSGYQKMFKKELEKAGKGIGGMSPKEKKDFFNKIDKKYKGKNEDLNKDDEKVVNKVKDMLKGASAKHAAQAKMLDKAMKTEADQHADEINQKRTDKVKADKKVADSGSKLTKVETEPKVNYKN